MKNFIRNKVAGMLSITLFILSSAVLSFEPEPVIPKLQGTQSVPGPWVVVLHDDRYIPHRVPPPEQAELGIQTADFTVNYNPASCTGSISAWPTNAQTAFQYAVNIWGSLLNSSQTIEVDACWRSDLDPDVLGSARAKELIADFPNAPIANTWYPIALANAIAGNDRNGANVEIIAYFNSTFNWYFGTDGNTPANQKDFATVVLHELGHGLGFFGSMNVDDGDSSNGNECTGNAGIGCWGSEGYPYIYDHFAEDNNGISLLDTSTYPNNSVTLAGALTSGDVFFNGTNANAANGGARVELYAPSTWKQNSSYSHLDQTFNNTPNALMTFSLGNGESIHNPGGVVLGMFGDMSWDTRGQIFVNIANPSINADGFCSLVEAIINANNDAQNYADCPAGFGIDTIHLQAPSPLYELTNSLPSITSGIIINGNRSGSKSLIRRSEATGTPDFRIFHVAIGGSLSLDKVIVNNGREYDGGGIFNQGTLMLIDSDILANNATHNGGGVFNFNGKVTLTNKSRLVNNEAGNNGGGIYNDVNTVILTEKSRLVGNNASKNGGGIFNNSGTAELTNSTVSGNSASDDGGGIFTGGNGTVELTNSTVSGNSASDDGGGIFHLGGLNPMNLRFSTISRNMAPQGGGIFNDSGIVQLFGTIVAKQGNGGDCAGEITSFIGYNLDSDNTCNLTMLPNLPGKDPVIGQLQDNSGPTFTHGLMRTTDPAAPPKDSPAIDAIPLTIPCPSTDQRGQPRPADGNEDGITGCDIGAFERQEGETAIILLSFTARPAADHITLAWQTGTEIDNAGFNLHRATAADGPYTRLNDVFISAEGDPVSGASYTYIDTKVSKGGTYYYKLEDVDFYGVSTFHGPVSATAGAQSVYLPLILK